MIIRKKKKNQERNNFKGERFQDFDYIHSLSVLSLPSPALKANRLKMTHMSVGNGEAHYPPINRAHIRCLVSVNVN